MPQFNRRILTSLALTLLTFAAPVSAQTSEGPKFLGVGERGDNFSRFHADSDCDYIYLNVEFCRDNTNWVTERPPVRKGEAVYKASDQNRASFVILPLEDHYGTHDLEPAQINAFLEQQIFENGPRGSLTIEAVLSETRKDNGQIQKRTAIVTNPDGARLLSQVDVLHLDYGLGFFETTQEIGADVSVTGPSVAQIAFHEAFLETTKVTRYSSIETPRN